MRKFLICACVVYGVYALVREYRPAPRFNGAEGTIQVERLGSGGDVIREDFQPSLAHYLAVYHGAGWCPPCQRFSPRLAEFYHDADKTKLRFQLVMVNYDHSDEEMVAYMRQHKMEFPATTVREAGRWGASTGSGIPNLIIIDTATGKVVSSSYEGSSYVGCEKPLGVLRRIVAQGHP
jgi:thiol-disulfide isomerase/thioredoxin